ncbi:MAG: hypothetical protein JRI68_29870 [Deltaproteobacteria bacterium]|nr:hypothetical protein [Deltaproteobacteria bacterium]
MMNRRNADAVARYEERVKREDEAPRLHDEVPRLLTLRIELDECRQDDDSLLLSHARHIVVDRAPARFTILCGDSECVDGGYRLTRQVMNELRSGSTVFEGQEDCGGRRNGEFCLRRVHFTARATYAE